MTTKAAFVPVSRKRQTAVEMTVRRAIERGELERKPCGRKGGLVKSEAKATAVRANGRKGGRRPCRQQVIL